ncbi:hypothetical protein CUROG_04405 [Corynebacterium urogenitale]|uniref:Uncharacterized protein n=1 Tax=Corynebacterium urogenitale TaxID=2487892 RepID=A0A5J6Z5F5_9CORY|nr:hypothetical protein [Corynebacterium urogenitale]QFQ02256.1 hypothetical protein CUROG_04405 [Corynebacterium urogenitale]
MDGMNPALVADAHRRRQEEESKSLEQRQEELTAAVDALLARDVQGADEVEVLEEAHRLVNDALGRG